MTSKHLSSTTLYLNYVFFRRGNMIVLSLSAFINYGYFELPVNKFKFNNIYSYTHFSFSALILLMDVATLVENKIYINTTVKQAHNSAIDKLLRQHIISQYKYSYLICKEYHSISYIYHLVCKCQY